MANTASLLLGLIAGGIALIRVGDTLTLHALIEVHQNIVGFRDLTFHAEPLSLFNPALHQSLAPRTLRPQGPDRVFRAQRPLGAVLHSFFRRGHPAGGGCGALPGSRVGTDRTSTLLNSSH